MEPLGSRARRLHILVCVVGLGLYIQGFRQQTTIARLPPELPLELLSFPVEVEGLIADGPERLRFLAEGWPIGRALELSMADGTTRSVVLVARRDEGYLWTTAGSAAVFWIMALVAFAPRVQRRGGLYFFWMTFLYGLGIAVGGIYFRGDRPGAWSIPGYLQVAALAFLPVIFLQMTLSFPRRLAVWTKTPWLVPALWGLAAVLLVREILGLEAFFRHSDVAGGIRLGAAQRLSDIVLVAEATVGVALLFHQGRTAATARERDQVRWLLRGFVVGAAPYVFLRTLPRLLDLPPLLPPHADRVLELAIPAAFLLVMVRHRLLDTDVILRRGLLYGTAATILVAGYVLVALIVKPIPIGVAGWVSNLMWVLLGVGGGLLFRPLRKAVAVWIDRNIFDILREQDDLLRDLDRVLDRADTPDDVARALTPRLVAAFRPRRHLVLWSEGGTTHAEGRRKGEEAAEILAAWRDTACARFAVAAAPQSTDQPAAELPEFPAVLRDRGFVLGASLRTDGSFAGLVAVGPRASGRHYVRREIRLLGAMAERASARLERIRLMRRIVEEQAERRRLDELHRAKSDFLSRVAHDLRTPITSISWSVQNLMDGVVGPVAPEQVECLRSIEHTSAYQRRLVENLLRMSLLETGGVEADCGDVDVGAVVRRSRDLLAPSAQASRVALDLRFPDAPVMARADAHLLEEALVNVLENAVKYSPPDGTVDVDVEAADDEVRIRIRDRGPGLPAGMGEKLFERFAQGPPSPWSSREGFGLGLHIAHAHLRLMGGDLRAEDHTEGGSVFTCALRRGDAKEERP